MCLHLPVENCALRFIISHNISFTNKYFYENSISNIALLAMSFKILKSTLQCDVSCNRVSTARLKSIILEY